MLRDVEPDKVPVALHNTDGTSWQVCDFPAELVAGMEQLAHKRRQSFNALMTSTIAEAIIEALRKLRGF